MQSNCSNSNKKLFVAKIVSTITMRKEKFHTVTKSTTDMVGKTMSSVAEQKGKTMLEKIKRAYLTFNYKHNSLPEIVFMSEEALEKMKSEVYIKCSFQDNVAPQSLFGMRIKTVPIPNDIIIVGGVMVNQDEEEKQ